MSAPSILSLPQLQKNAGLTANALAPPASLAARVSALALLSILDHWTHRDLDAPRVVGALLGTRSEDGTVLDITDAFPIVLLADQELAIDVDFANTMHQLRRRTNSKEVVLGWYSTGSALDETSPGLHDWFEANLISTAGSFHHGVHLLVDTSLASDDLGVQGFIGLPVTTLADGIQGRVFVPFPVQVAPAEHEISGLEAIATAAIPRNHNHAALPQHFGPDDVHQRVTKLEHVVDASIQYVEATLAALKAKKAMTGAEAATLNRLGHTLARVVAARTDATDLARMDDEIRDLKTVLDLAAQARKQMQVAELVMYGAAFKV